MPANLVSRQDYFANSMRGGKAVVPPICRTCANPCLKIMYQVRASRLTLFVTIII
jgi:hypothetical protein